MGLNTTLLSDNAVKQWLPLSTTDAIPATDSDAKLEMLAAAPSDAAFAAATPWNPPAPDTASALPLPHPCLMKTCRLKNMK